MMIPDSAQQTESLSASPALSFSTCWFADAGAHQNIEQEDKGGSIGASNWQEALGSGGTCVLQHARYQAI